MIYQEKNSQITKIVMSLSSEIGDHLETAGTVSNLRPVCRLLLQSSMLTTMAQGLSCVPHQEKLSK